MRTIISILTLVLLVGCNSSGEREILTQPLDSARVDMVQDDSSTQNDKGKQFPQLDPNRYNVAFLIMNGVYNTELTAPFDIFQHTITGTALRR